MTSQPQFDRRNLLKSGLSLGGMTAFSALSARSAHARGRGKRATLGDGYGPLLPARDFNTGLNLIKLPRGFRYTTFGWTLDPLSDGSPTPCDHDGMAVVRSSDNRHVIVRNHEIRGVGSSFGAPGLTFDAKATGGTTTLVFNGHTVAVEKSAVSIAGTLNNCAGGPTPWGSWLTGEETTLGKADGYDEDHGFLFEVPGLVPANPVPLRDMGRFAHEAVAVDPVTGYVYETEDDRYTSGLYRFRPNVPGRLFGLAQGGALEMLRVVGTSNANLQVVNTGDEFDVDWVPIADPELQPQTNVGTFGGIGGSTRNASGPFFQGYSGGGARFRRLEGIWTSPDGLIYFVDTEGGPAAPDTGEPEGAIWCYDPARERLRVVFVSPAETILDNPDNITVSPRGGLLLCEDGDLSGLRMQGLSPDGQLFPFAENAVVLNGEKNGFVGDFRGREWAGATFDPTGDWLFANIQDPGITFAITGPWRRGLL